MKTILKGLLIVSTVLAIYSVHAYRVMVANEQSMANVRQTVLMLDAREAHIKSVQKQWKDHGIDLPRSLIQ